VLSGSSKYANRFVVSGGGLFNHLRPQKGYRMKYRLHLSSTVRYYIRACIHR
jgi:hypothetical protein